MKSRRSLRKMIIEELINDDAIFAGQQAPGDSNQELIKKMIKHNDKNLTHPDSERHGSYMTHNQLFNICEQAQYLLSNVPEGSTLEPWMESKLTVASEALDSVFKSLYARLEREK